MMSTQKQTEFLVSYIVDRLTEFLMSDYGFDIARALQVIYDSETYKRLADTKNSLYIQSPSYIYELLSDEFKLTTSGATKVGNNPFSR